MVGLRKRSCFDVSATRKEKFRYILRLKVCSHRNQVMKLQGKELNQLDEITTGITQPTDFRFFLLSL